MFFPSTHKPRNKWQIAYDLRRLAEQAERVRDLDNADRLWRLHGIAMVQAAATDWPLA